MIIIYINDFIFTDISKKYYPFLEIIEHLKQKKYKVKLITTELFRDEEESITFKDSFRFIERESGRFYRGRKNKLIHGIKILIKGYPFFIFRKLIRLKSENILVHLTSGFFPIVFGSIICKLFNIPCLIGPNAIPSKNLIFKNISDSRNFPFFLRDLLISRLPNDKLICFSEYHKNILIKEFDLKSKNIEIIKIGINSDIFKILETNNLKKKLFNNDSKIILYVGTTEEEKGFNQFIRISRKLLNNESRINILIIGIKDDILFKELNEEFREYNNFKIFKWVARSDLAKYYTISDLFINPSTDETWSMTTIEALSCGTPCICSNIPIFKQHIKQHVNGLLFELNNDRDLLSKIKTGLNIDWNRKEISKSALDKYNWNNSVKKIIKTYNKLIEN